MTQTPQPRALGRRAVLGGLAAAPIAGLAGCMFGSDPVAAASHPALAAPREEAVVALVAVPPDPRRARAALAALATQVRVADAGGTPAMLAIGHTWFAKAGLADRRPRGLAEMPGFRGDRLESPRSHGDLLVQVEADTGPAAARAAARMLDGLAATGSQVRWQVAGGRAENMVRDGRSLTRNALGFVEGVGNRDSRDGPAVDGVTLITAGGGVPAWSLGGTYLVLRVVRLDRAAWDAETPAEQEQIIGRRTDGRWLDGTPAEGEPDFGNDPYGFGTPLDSHVRAANPRTPDSSAPPLVRRSWSYAVEGPVVAREEGVLFMCYQADVEAGFAAVQRRLEKQALNDYVATVGGGYFVVPPSDPAPDRPWEQALLA